MALMNPLSILFWLGIYGSILAKSIENQHLDQVLWNSMGIFVGILLWDVVMAMLSSFLHRFTGPSMLRFISLTAGFAFLVLVSTSVSRLLHSCLANMFNNQELF